MSNGSEDEEVEEKKSHCILQATVKWLCRKALWFEYKGNAVLQEMETLLWDPLDPS